MIYMSIYIGVAKAYTSVWILKFMGFRDAFKGLKNL